MRSLLPECKFSHVDRETNMVAHSLAQRAYSLQECVVVRFNAPQCVRSMIREDAPSVAAPPNSVIRLD
jgi:hypothetical protein